MDETDVKETIAETAVACFAKFLDAVPDSIHEQSPLPTKRTTILMLCGFISKGSGLEFLPLDGPPYPATLGDLIAELCSKVKKA